MREDLYQRNVLHVETAGHTLSACKRNWGSITETQISQITELCKNTEEVLESMFLGSKSKPSRKPAEAGNCHSACRLPPLVSCVVNSLPQKTLAVSSSEMLEFFKNE
jgi:hypothetical protein